MEKKENAAVMLEANVDDATGETMAHAVERLLSEGAMDAHLIPIISKKGRPGVILRVMCRKEDTSKFAVLIGKETGSLGVKELQCIKHMFQREEKEVETKYGKVKVKIAKDSQGNIVSKKAEFDDVKKIAEKQGNPLRVMRKLIDNEVQP